MKGRAVYSTSKSVTALATMWAFLLLPNLTKKLNAYDLPTHQAIAERAVGVTSLSSYLRNQLGLRGGVAETFLGQRVDQWIISGAQFEDIPDARVRHHFHNPLRPWGQAGLTFLGVQLGESSVMWNQEPQQDSYLFAGNGSWSWHNARKQFFDALTGTAKAQREKSFADLFRSLGQGTHLLQDATVPAHVRDDAHLNVPVPFVNIYFPDPDGYEKWALNNGAVAGTFIGLEPTVPPLSIFTPTGDSQAPSPVARLFDTDRFQAGNSGILSDPALGIAEFTNGNFLSESTIFRDFTLPRATELAFNQPIEEIVDGSVERYYSRTLPTGETVPHFVREGMLRKALRAVNLSPDISSSWVLDERVHADYARLLLPRAVGYSAALLDYFFRGRLKGVLRRVNGPIANIGDFIPIYVFTLPYTVELKLTNESTEQMQGDFRLYIDRPDGTRTQLWEWTQQTLAAGATQALSFTVPHAFGDVELFFVVFQGRLGQEDGAVAGSMVGPEFIEEWDKGLAGNHPFVDNRQTFFMPVPHPDDNKQIIKVENEKLVMEIVQENPTTGDRYNTVRIGPGFDENGNLIRDPRALLPVPITSRTVIKLKYDINNEQPPCSVGRTCRFQFIEFGFSGQRYIQFTTPGQAVRNLHYSPDARVLAFVPVNPGTPLTVNIHDMLTQNGIPADNLVLEKIVVTQGLVAYPDPAPRRLHMEVDYIRVTDPDLDSDPGSGGGVVADGNSPPVGAPPRVTLTSPDQGEVFEGETITLSVDAA